MSEKKGFVGFDVTRGLVLKRMTHGLLVHFLVMIKGIVTLPIYTRLLGTSGYGLLGLIFTTAGILIPFFTLNLCTGSSIHIASLTSNKEVSKSYYSSLYTAILLTVTLSVVMYFASDLFLSQSVTKYVWIILIYVFISIVYAFATLVPQVFQKTKFLGASRFLIEYSGAALSIILLYMGFGVIGVIFGIIASYTLGSLIINYLVGKDIGLYKSISPDIVKKYVLYSIPLIPITFSQWIMRGLDRYFILYFYDTSQVGIYSVAGTVAGVILAVQTAVFFVTYSSLVKLWEENKQKFYVGINELTKWLLILLTLAVVLFYLSSSFIVIILAGDDFIAAGVVVPILALALAISIYSHIFNTMLNVIKKPKMIMISFIPAAIFNAILNFLLIPLFGINGAAIATLLSYAASTGLLILFVHLYYDFKVDAFLHLKILVVGVVLVFIVFSIKQHVDINLYSIIPIALLITFLYISLLFITKSVGIYETKQLFKSIIQHE